MQHLKLTGLAAAALAGGLIATSLPLLAAPPKKPDVAIGYVDLAKVTEQVKTTAEWSVLVKTYEDMKVKFEAEIDELNKTRYLTKDEMTELTNLRAKKNATEGEKARIVTLEQQSDNLDREFSKLAGTEKLSDTEQKRIAVVDTTRRNGIAALQNQANARRVELEKMQTDVLDSMQKKIIAKVEDVASNKDLVLVLDRQAVLSGGQDLTGDVLRKLGAVK